MMFNSGPICMLCWGPIISEETSALCDPTSKQGAYHLRCRQKFNQSTKRFVLLNTKARPMITEQTTLAELAVEAGKLGVQRMQLTIVDTGREVHLLDADNRLVVAHGSTEAQALNAGFDLLRAHIAERLEKAAQDTTEDVS